MRTHLTPLALALSLLGSSPVWAIEVADETQLRNAIFAINDGGADTAIVLTEDITLTRSLPMMRRTMSIDGDNHIIDANDAGRVFMVVAGEASISNVNIRNALAQGGQGGKGTVRAAAVAVAWGRGRWCSSTPARRPS